MRRQPADDGAGPRFYGLRPVSDLNSEFDLEAKDAKNLAVQLIALQDTSSGRRKDMYGVAAKLLMEPLSSGRVSRSQVYNKMRSIKTKELNEKNVRDLCDKVDLIMTQAKTLLEQCQEATSTLELNRVTPMGLSFKVLNFLQSVKKDGDAGTLSFLMTLQRCLHGMEAKNLHYSSNIEFMFYVENNATNLMQLSEASLSIVSTLMTQCHNQKMNKKEQALSHLCVRYRVARMCCPSRKRLPKGVFKSLHDATMEALDTQFETNHRTVSTRVKREDQRKHS